jgi:hypothetical protein
VAADGFFRGHKIIAQGVKKPHQDTEITKQLRVSDRAVSNDAQLLNWRLVLEIPGPETATASELTCRKSAGAIYPLGNPSHANRSILKLSKLDQERFIRLTGMSAMGRKRPSQGTEAAEIVVRSCQGQCW